MKRLTASVAAPHPAAVEAARAAWAEGGNALDLALAAATALAVAYPHQCSLGGDLVALVRDPDGTVTAHLSFGAAPQAVDVAALRALGGRMPPGGPHPVTVPGALAGWAALAEAGARLPLADRLRRAAALARDGVPVAPGLERAIAASAPQIAADPGLSALLTPGGRALGSADALVQPALARTLDAIAADGPGAFYGGAVGAALVAGLQAAGSAMTLADLAAHAAETAAPLSDELHGATWHVAPPPSAGITLLAMLDGLDAGRLPLQRARAAAAARDRLLGDPRRGPLDLDGLRTTVFAEPAHAGRAPAGNARAAGDTVAIAAVDSEGRAVTVVQSVYQTFGAALLEPATGIVLHNRGSAFSLEPGHPAEIGGGLRPPHTLCPAIVAAGGAVVAAGCQGGRAQPQVLAQIAADLADPAADLPAAIARPRWVVGSRDMDREVETVLAEPEAGVAAAGASAPDAFAQVAAEAAALGVAFERLAAPSGLAGHVQAARLAADGGQQAATDPRADGVAATFAPDPDDEDRPS